MNAEFSRIVRLDEIGRMQWPVQVEANETERTALAQRFGFLSLDALAARYSLTRDGKTITATGTIEASLSQPCIASGEPVPETVREDFLIRFVPDSEQGGDQADEIELDADDCDIVPYSGERIDMGDAIAETLALAINPYPRGPDADAFLRKAGVLTESEAGPFAALAALRNKG